MLIWKLLVCQDSENKNLATVTRQVTSVRKDSWRNWQGNVCKVRSCLQLPWQIYLNVLGIQTATMGRNFILITWLFGPSITLGAEQICTNPWRGCVRHCASSLFRQEKQRVSHAFRKETQLSRPVLGWRYQPILSVCEIICSHKVAS